MHPEGAGLLDLHKRQFSGLRSHACFESFNGRFCGEHIEMHQCHFAMHRCLSPEHPDALPLVTQSGGYGC